MKKTPKTIVKPLIKGYWLMLQEDLAGDECIDFYLKHEIFGDWTHVYGLPGLYDMENKLTPIDLSSEDSIAKCVTFFKYNLDEHIANYHEELGE